MNDKLQKHNLRWSKLLLWNDNRSFSLSRFCFLTSRYSWYVFRLFDVKSRQEIRFDPWVLLIFVNLILWYLCRWLLQFVIQASLKAFLSTDFDARSEFAYWSLTTYRSIGYIKINWVFPILTRNSLIHQMAKKIINKKDLYELWTPNLQINSQAS